MLNVVPHLRAGLVPDVHAVMVVGWACAVDSRSIDSIKLLILRVRHILADGLSLDIELELIRVGIWNHVLPIELNELLLGILLLRLVVRIIIELTVCNLQGGLGQRLGLGRVVRRSRRVVLHDDGVLRNGVLVLVVLAWVLHLARAQLRVVEVDIRRIDALALAGHNAVAHRALLEG